jgi:hypothetical protein
MKYAPLISINLIHGFYTKGKSPDFQLIPTPDCRQILKKHRLMWREKRSSWQLITALNELEEKEQEEKEEEQDKKDKKEPPLYPLKKDTILRFYLKPINPKAVQFTAFPAGFTIDKAHAGLEFLHFTNADGADLVPNKYHHEHTETFEVAIPSAKESFFLRTTPADIEDLTFSISDDIPDGLLLSYDKEIKQLIFKTEDLEKKTKFKVSYRAAPPWPKGIIGIVDIEEKDPESLGKEYHFYLEPRSVHWHYYLVSDKDLGKLELIEKTTDENPIKFEKLNIKTPPEGDPTAQWLKKKYPDAVTRALFRSKDHIPYQEKRSVHIQLTYDGAVIIKHLPTPSRENSEIQIVNNYS